MTVELGEGHRARRSRPEITVVGNLIGEATVSVAPRAAGRLEEVTVRLGDRVSRGQRVAKIEDFEIQEQVKQAEAAQEVSEATIRQREADLQLAQTNVERSRNLFERQLLPKQTLDDNESRYQSALASVDLARAQSLAVEGPPRRAAHQPRQHHHHLAGERLRRRAARSIPGAFVSQNAPIVDVVDITTVRLVANVVEKDLKELQTGDATRVEVDAYPGRRVHGPHRPRVAGARPGHPHGADRDRDSQPAATA